MKDQTILEFKGVIVSDYRDSGREIEDVSFRVDPGELVLIEGWPARFPLADPAEGLVEPKTGQVFFGGNDWTDLSPTAAAAARGRIGRFFPQSGWVSNLNVDENITLSVRHHSHRPLEETEPFPAPFDPAGFNRGFGADPIPAGPGVPRRAGADYTGSITPFRI